MVFLRLLEPLGQDFPQLYEAALMVWQGLNPYETLLTSPGPFNYPPTAFLFLWWVGLFPFETAAVVWNLLSLLSLGISIAFLVKLARHKGFILYSLFFIFLFTLPFFPVKHNLASGQINHFILLLTVGSLFLYRSGHKTASAAFLAFAAGIKLVPVIFLLYFGLKKDWGMVGKCLAFLTLFFGATLLFVPWEFQATYFTKIFFEAWPLAGKAIYYNQSLLGFLARTFHQEVVIKGLMYGLSAALVGFTLVRAKKITDLRLLSAISCLYLLLHPLAWQHHFVMAVIPLILLTADLTGITADFLDKNRFFNMVFIAFCYVLIAWNIKEPGEVPFQFTIVLSHQFIGVFLLWVQSLWREKLAGILGLVWISTLTVGYLLIILCRAKICL